MRPVTEATVGNASALHKKRGNSYPSCPGSMASSRTGQVGEAVGHGHVEMSGRHEQLR